MRHYANRSDLSLNGFVEMAGRAERGRQISRDWNNFDIADVMVEWWNGGMVSDLPRFSGAVAY